MHVKLAQLSSLYPEKSGFNHSHKGFIVPSGFIVPIKNTAEVAEIIKHFPMDICASAKEKIINGNHGT